MSWRRDVDVAGVKVRARHVPELIERLRMAGYPFVADKVERALGLRTVPVAFDAAEREAIVATQGKTRTLGVFARLLLAVVLGIAMIFWPYSVRCGAGLFGYLTAIGVLITAGVWTAVWTWRHRTARGHIVSLAVLSWGLLLGATELLPRLGYAKPTPEHPAIWMCQ